MGARARTALAIVTLPYASRRIMEEDLYQLLSGACTVLQRAGCSLVGGHTAEGSDLTLGKAPPLPPPLF
jgi:selenide,water dikinase